MKIRKLLPDFVSNLFVRQPYSTTSFIGLQGLKECLEGYQVINCLEVFSFVSYQCASIAEKMEKPLTISVFETIPMMPLHHIPPYQWNVRKVLKHADLFIAFTRKAASCLMSLGVSNEKIRVIYPGIDLDLFHPAKSRNHEKFRILFVGGYNREKGLSTLLPAFLRLCKDGFDIELWICASHATGEEERLTQIFAKKYPIRILGYVEHSKIPEVYRQCDVFCHPSFDRKKYGVKIWEEQFGFALVEAMASGLPIIATDCGVMPEVTGRENIVAPQKSVDALYLALRRIIRDDDHRRYLARRNRIRAEKLFDIRKQRKKLDEALLNLIN